VRITTGNIGVVVFGREVQLTLRRRTPTDNLAVNNAKLVAVADADFTESDIVVDLCWHTLGFPLIREL